MTDSLPADARSLLARMIRSSAPWRATTVSKAELLVVGGLVAAGLVSLDAGVYRPTSAGRAAVARPISPSELS